MSKAKVFDMTTAQLERRLEREAPAGDEQQQQAEQSIAADMADGIEAIHQCLNLANFTHRPRAFVLALADAAKRLGSDYVTIRDSELAKMQNCCTRTVERQRADYMEESEERHFAPIEVEEGDYDWEAKQNLPMRYKFHLTEFIDETVRQARASSQWHETDRRQQREAIRIAADDNYSMIPDAPLKRRKKKHPRSAVDEMKTRLKVILTNLEKLEEMGAELPADQREELLNEADPDGFINRWARMRPKLDAVENVTFTQVTEGTQVKEGYPTICRVPPSVETDEEPEADPEAAATWERLEERLTTPAVRSVEIELHRPDGPPGPVSQLPDELEEELTLEEERAAIMQYDGGLRREVADALARGEVVNRRDDHASRREDGNSKPATARDGPSG